MQCRQLLAGMSMLMPRKPPIASDSGDSLWTFGLEASDDFCKSQSVPSSYHKGALLVPCTFSTASGLADIVFLFFFFLVTEHNKFVRTCPSDTTSPVVPRWPRTELAFRWPHAVSVSNEPCSSLPPSSLSHGSEKHRLYKLSITVNWLQ